MLDNVDDDGNTMANALRAYGPDPGRISDAAHDPEQVLGFVELHIEQGPVLESENDLRKATQVVALALLELLGSGDRQSQ